MTETYEKKADLTGVIKTTQEVEIKVEALEDIDGLIAQYQKNIVNMQAEIAKLTSHRTELAKIGVQEKRPNKFVIGGSIEKA